MCGIVGYLGPRDATPIIHNGLKRLDYRGYDSPGLGVVHHGKLELRKDAGKISQLVELVERSTGRSAWRAVWRGEPGTRAPTRQEIDEKMAGLFRSAPGAG